MTIFSKLFGSSEARKVRKLFEDVHQKQLPISNLARVIGSGSIACGEAMKPHLNFKTEDEASKQLVHVCFEFMYFFLHMTNRQAHTQLQPEQMRKLQSELVPLVALPSIEAFFNHWPEDLKEKITVEFYQKFNQAELDYSTSKELLAKDNPPYR